MISQKEKIKRLIIEMKSLKIDNNNNLDYKILNLPLKSIQTDLTLFQNREEEYSEVSVNAIVDEALEKGKLNNNKFQPITVWQNNNQYFILAGHSRFEAFKRLSNHFHWANNIPTKIFEGTRAEAVEFARNSNSFNDPEKITARAKLYRAYRLDKQWSNAQVLNYIKKNEKNYPVQSVFNLSFLNPNGNTIQNYKQFLNASDSTMENMRAVADWIGEARRLFPELSDLHENELFEYLSDYKIFTKLKAKQNFINEVKSFIIGLKPNERLNIKKLKSYNEIMSRFEDEVNQIKNEIKKAVRDCESNNPQVKYWANKLIELENKRTRVAEDAKKQSALFGFKDDENELLAFLEVNAVPFRFIKYKENSFVSEFGHSGEVATPIGLITIDYIQFDKISYKDRESYFGLILPTLTEPCLVIWNELLQKHFFIKSFIDKKRGTIYFVSISKEIDGVITIVTNHEKRENQIKKIVQEGAIAYQINSGENTALGKTEILSPNHYTFVHIGLLYYLNTEQKKEFNKFQNNQLGNLEIKNLIKELKSLKIPKNSNDFIDNSFEILFGKNSKNISNEALDVLKKAKKTEKEVIFDFQMPRNVYNQIKEILENIGGKWQKKGGKNQDGSPKGSIVFDRFNPKYIIEYIIKHQKLPLKNPTDFFPTPKEIVNEMLDYINFENTCSWKENINVLEPSAGTGGIAEIIREKCPKAKIDCVEYLSVNAKILDEKGFNVIHEDFLKLNTNKKYDIIVMNPPFDGTTYIDHIYKAYQLLRDYGKLVSVIPNTIHRSDKKTTEFYNFIACNNGDMYDLPDNSFKSSGTSVATKLVRFEKRKVIKAKYNGYGSYDVWHFVAIVESNFRGELMKDLEYIFKKHLGDETSLKKKLKDFIDDSIKYIRKEQGTLFCLDTSGYNEIIEKYLEYYEEKSMY